MKIRAACITCVAAACLLPWAARPVLAGVVPSAPVGIVAQHPALGAVERIPAAPQPPAPKRIDGRTSDWDAGVRLTHLGGTTTVQAGQLIYEGWLLDDSGAAPTCEWRRDQALRPIEELLGWSKFEDTDSAAGVELIPDADAVGITDQQPIRCYVRGVERYGGAAYPPGSTPGAADILELRVAADQTNVYFLVQLDAMTASDAPVVAIAADTDMSLSTGTGEWGLGSGVVTPGADHVVTLTRDTVLLDGAPVPGGRVASHDGGKAGPQNAAGFGGVIEASLPRTAIAPTHRWRLWAGAGVWDAATRAWRAPVQQDPGPRVMDLAFRGGHESLHTWMEQAQAFSLRAGWDGAVSHLDATFTQTVDLDALAGGENERWRIRPGYYVRSVLTHVTDGGRRGGPAPSNVEDESMGARQPYGLYVPSTYDPARPAPVLLWLHWRGPGDQQAAYYVPGMVRQLAEERGAILVSPRGRGSSGWYVGDSQIDVLDALADAESLLSVDRDKVVVGGYSMGGWGTYLLAMQYPDLFAAAFVVVGPPAIGAWAYPAPPTMPQNGRPLYFTNPMVGNARHVPFVIYHGTDDELVPVSGTVAQAQTFARNRQPYELYVFPGYEHFSFAAVDEWARAQAYLAGRTRVRDPAQVSYTRLPCLDPVRWSPLYDRVADRAYWVSGITVRDASPDSACTDPNTGVDVVNRGGSVDAVSHMLPRFTDAGNSIASTGVLAGQSTPWVMTGFAPADGTPLPHENVLDIHVANISSLRIDVRRAQLDDRAMLRIPVQTDGPTILWLDGAPELLGARVSIDGTDAGAFAGSVRLPAGTHQVVISPGGTRAAAESGVRVLPNTGASTPFVLHVAALPLLGAAAVVVRRRRRAGGGGG